MNTAIRDHNASFSQTVDSLTKNVSHFWWSTDYDKINDIESFAQYSLIEKMHTEKKLDGFIDEIFQFLFECPSSKEARIKWQNELWIKLESFGEELGFSEAEISSDFSRELRPVTSLFIKDAREFMNTYMGSFNLMEVFQALRNLWIVNLLQWMFGMKPTYSKSIFSYSMLYPYTDNFLDDESITDHVKESINNDFLKILKGVPPVSDDVYVKGFSHLIHNISEEYPRSSFKDLHTSLVAIHVAQCSAMKTQRGIFSPYVKDIMGASVFKGGTSVLADSYLIQGDVPLDKAEFAFAYGALLQFCDDLQDVESDYSSQSMTIFSQMKDLSPLDILTNKLFNFVDVVMDLNKGFVSQDSINPFVKKNINFLILQAVAQNRSLYSKKYIRNISKHMPYRMNYMDKMHRSFQKRSGKFRSKNGYTFDEVILFAVE